MKSVNLHTANVPMLSQRHPPRNPPTHALSNHAFYFPPENGIPPERDNLSPDAMTLEVLNEKARDFRLLLQTPADNVLMPFINDVAWRTESPRIVHGTNPTIECAGCFQRCSLCIQHSLSRSLPAAVRQKSLLHDHCYDSRQPREELRLATQVALGLIEKNYAEAYKNLISNAEEKTNPCRIFTRPGECECGETVERRQDRVHLEDTESILSSPWARFDEIELCSSAPLRNCSRRASEGSTSQPSVGLEPMDQGSRDDMFFIVKARPSKQDPSSRTSISIETYHSNHEPRSVSTLPTENKILPNGRPRLVLRPSGRPEGAPARQDPVPIPLCNYQNRMSISSQGMGNTTGCTAVQELASSHVGGHQSKRPPQGANSTRPDAARKTEIRCAGINHQIIRNSNPIRALYLPLRRKTREELARSKQNHNAIPGRNSSEVSALGTERAPSQPALQPTLMQNSCPPRATNTRCSENRPARTVSTRLNTFETAENFDPPNPPMCSNKCCLDSKAGDRKHLEQPAKCQAERRNEVVLVHDQISAKCPTCGIMFRKFGVVRGACVTSHTNPVARVMDHRKLHRVDSLNCVFPSCRELTFNVREELVAHMDAHRQSLIFGGVEQWEDRNTAPLLQPRFTKPHLTCEICLIDFNWRTTLPGMLSHTERFIRHYEKHRAMMGEGDYCPWQCVLRGCEKKFTSQATLEEHMWTAHAVPCHCSTCDWIIWGDTDEVHLHREQCTAQLTDVDTKDFGMKSSVRNAPIPSTSGITSKISSGIPLSVRYSGAAQHRQRPKLLKNKTTQVGKPIPAKLDTASSANHLMRFTYYCNFCGAPFRSHHQKQYQRHVQSHLPDKQLTCVYGDCGLRFDSLEELHSHVKTKLSTCRYCGAVHFINYKKHILTCRPLHEIKKQCLLKEEYAKVKYAPVEQEDLYWSEQKLCRSNLDTQQSAEVPKSEGQECFLRNLNLVKGSFETISAKTRRRDQLRSQIHVANGKGRRACTEKTSCAQCGRIFGNALNLLDHLRGYHNARDF